MTKQEKYNICKIGELQVQSTTEPLKNVIDKTKELLKDQTVQEYLRFIDTKKIKDCRTYWG